MAERPRYPRRADGVSFLFAFGHLAFVLCPVLLAARVGPSLWLIPLWLWFGVSMHGILNLMHEASHSLVFRERWMNDVLGHWVLGPLVLSDFDAYRLRHWDHHRFIGEERDTKDAYLLDVRGTRLVGFLLRCLTLRQAVEKLGSTGAGDAAGPADRAWLGRALILHAALAAVLLGLALVAAEGDWRRALTASALAWGFVFAYGMASLTLFVASLRTLAEHGPSDDGATRVGRAFLRNFSCGPLGRFVMGSYGFAEHATHHREPAVPAYHLPAATRRLIEEGAEELRPKRGGYPAQLWAAVRG